MIERLCIIGVGLIGGSLARAARAAGACREIVGCGRNTANLERGVELGVIDRYETDIARAVEGADMVVVAVPLGALEGVFDALKGRLADHAVVTDVGSAKASVVAAAERVFGNVPAWLVPGHPIAGTERSGVEASLAELYQGRRVILTPLAVTAPTAVARVRALWEAAGADVVEMAVDHHDEVLAATSHLPHMLAFTLVDALARRADREDIFDYAAGGFRDFTRIASSDPRMWCDICLANRDALMSLLQQFCVDLNQLSKAIDQRDGDTLMDIFTRAKTARDKFAGKDG